MRCALFPISYSVLRDFFRLLRGRIVLSWAGRSQDPRVVGPVLHERNALCEQWLDLALRFEPPCDKSRMVGNPEVTILLILTSGWPVTRAQSPNEQPGHNSALPTNRLLLPESRFAKSKLIKGVPRARF